MDMPLPTPDAARTDLAYIKHIVTRAQQRVDPHAFHFVHWGAIVLVWFPLANVFEHMGHLDWMGALGACALLVGILLSVVREKRLSRRVRLPDEDPFVGDQVMWIAFVSIGAGMVLSIAAPALRFMDGHDVPTLWGLIYANLAAMTGIVYRREFLWSGLAIFLATIAAMVWPEWNGAILGPVMGLGLLVPGWRAEQRVRALAQS
jgi:hypothetical protein